MMQWTRAKVAVVSLGSISLFLAAVLLLLHMIPGPRKPLDYVVIGSVATFAAMFIVFVVVFITTRKGPQLDDEPMPNYANRIFRI